MYVVWSSQRGAREENVGAAKTLIPDPRVRDYWDPHLLVGSAFESALDIQEPAWDVYMLFGPNARWPAEGTPVPEWYEHQLGDLPRERLLDPTRFADKAAALERSRP